MNVKTNFKTQEKSVYETRQRGGRVYTRTASVSKLENQHDPVPVSVSANPLPKKKEEKSLENILNIPIEEYNSKHKAFMMLSGKITLLEILKDRGYKKALAAALEEEIPFITQYHNAGRQKIEEDLNTLYKHLSPTK